MLFRATEQIIDDWIKERQKLLVLFYQILQIQPFDDDHINSKRGTLQNFCQLLTDYVSAGHFEVFEKIFIDGETATYSKNKIYHNLLIDILRTTSSIMAFSNKYSKRNISLKNVDSELSNLGEQLAKRMELEDNLVQIYLNLTRTLKIID